MDKRELILEATLQLVLQEGFYHLNMKKVAKAAGVAAGTTYLYFISKDELINELYRYVMSLYLTAVLQVPPTEDNLVKKLKGMLRRYLQFFLQRPDCFSFLRQFHSSPFAFKKEDTHKERLEPVYAQVEDARDQGILKNLPTPILFSLILGPIYEIVSMWRAGVINLLDTAVQEQFLAACWESVLSPSVGADKKRQKV